MRTVLVTGANKEIGHEVARQLGSKGFHVFVGARSSEKGETATQALRKNGAVATFISLDVSAPESIRNAVQVVAGTADHLDVLVNNAGVILEGDNSIAQLDPETRYEDFPNQHAWAAACHAGLLAVAFEKQRTASHQCFQRWRAAGRRHGYVGPRLLPLQDCP
jgi:NAD(P)-dependent dehydrogenase (short-subunit alcohol dehydrogenase family)